MPTGPFQFVWLGVADACKAPLEKPDSKLLTGRGSGRILTEIYGLAL